MNLSLFNVVYANTSDLIGKVNTNVFYPIINVLFAFALLLFLWGMVQFIINADNEDGRETGKSHMIWGLVGIFIMVSALGIKKMIENTIGV